MDDKRDLELKQVVEKSSDVCDSPLSLGGSRIPADVRFHDIFSHDSGHSTSLPPDQDFGSELSAAFSAAVSQEQSYSAVPGSSGVKRSQTERTSLKHRRKRGKGSRESRGKKFKSTSLPPVAHCHSFPVEPDSRFLKRKHSLWDSDILETQWKRFKGLCPDLFVSDHDESDSGLQVSTGRTDETASTSEDITDVPLKDDILIHKYADDSSLSFVSDVNQPSTSSDYFSKLCIGASDIDSEALGIDSDSNFSNSINDALGIDSGCEFSKSIREALGIHSGCDFSKSDSDASNIDSGCDFNKLISEALGIQGECDFTKIISESRDIASGCDFIKNISEALGIDSDCDLSKSDSEALDIEGDYDSSISDSDMSNTDSWDSSNDSDSDSDIDDDGYDDDADSDGNSSDDDVSDNDEEEMDIACPDSCVCQGGGQPKIPPFERKVVKPLYVKLLKYLTMTPENRYSNTCCEWYCQDSWARMTPHEVIKHYDNNDLSVHHFPWGTWKETDRECPNSCVCNTGQKTLKVEPIRRKKKLRVEKPLYKRLMKQRLMRKSNRYTYACCEERCNLNRWSKGKSSNREKRCSITGRVAREREAGGRRRNLGEDLC